MDDLDRIIYLLKEFSKLNKLFKLYQCYKANVDYKEYRQFEIEHHKTISKMQKIKSYLGEYPDACKLLK